MIRKEKFSPGEYYHIYNRTILKVPEFKNIRNAKKLAQTFLLGNSTTSGQAFEYLRNTQNSNIEKALEIAKSGEKLVDILCYSIMPNHYHILLKERRENGVTSFIRRCNTSIAKYINIKNDRLGSLFESNFKSKHINSNEYLLHLSVYIHLNPLDFLSSKEWRFNRLKNWKQEKEKLLKYSWSSLKYFLDKNFQDDIISGTEIILGQFKNRSEYEEFLRDWAMENLSEKTREIFIE